MQLAEKPELNLDIAVDSSVNKDEENKTMVSDVELDQQTVDAQDAT